MIESPLLDRILCRRKDRPSKRLSCMRSRFVSEMCRKIWLSEFEQYKIKISCRISIDLQSYVPIWKHSDFKSRPVNDVRETH